MTEEVGDTMVWVEVSATVTVKTPESRSRFLFSTSGVI